ncbi:MAG: hypothetical protein FWG98_03925 [Candidatus Cloacimonetes bacterium]|nr:hypothetical protein [Candidatus Cloacimonadota bacterium]
MRIARRDLATTGRGGSGTEIASGGVSEKEPRNDGKVSIGDDRLLRFASW